MTTTAPQNRLLLRDGFLSPMTRPVDSSKVNRELVDHIVDRKGEIDDLRKDWSESLPDSYGPIQLSARQRRKLQKLCLLLRNRRIVCGYELIDEKLQEKLAARDQNTPPLTWLTVGKWTAKAIGDLVNNEIFIPHKEKQLRWILRYFLVKFFSARIPPMGRILVTGNRVIFAQVGNLMIELLGIEFNGSYQLTYPDFVYHHGSRLQYAIESATSHAMRDPLSDSMLRAAHAYYRAMADSADRATWILVGNLHLAAYEQHVAQLFIDKSLSLRPRRAVRHLYKNPLAKFSWHKAVADTSWPHDLGLEGYFVGRLLDVVAATFATRYILSFPVGISRTRPRRREKDGEVFAPAYPFEKVDLRTDVRDYVHSLESPNGPATEASKSLKSIWSALDYAFGDAQRTPVRDWRSYPYRISYIANLFVVASQSKPYREEFLKPVLMKEDRDQFLSGKLPSGFGVRLKPGQHE